jgi:putative transposase
LRCRALRAQQGAAGHSAGSYERSLHTVAGEVNLKVPKLRRQTFETAIIERYRRRESSVEEALIEMGHLVSPSTVSNLNKKIYAKIEACRTGGLRAITRTSTSTASS